jgi:hypothetical protein
MIGIVRKIISGLRPDQDPPQKAAEEANARIVRLERKVAALDLKLSLLTLLQNGENELAVKIFNNTKVRPFDKDAAKVFFNDMLLARKKLEWNSHGIKKTVEKLSNVTPHVCFGFGTVLGLVREGDLIPHDDDIDLIVAVPGADDIAAGVELLGPVMQSAGFSIILRPGHLKVYKKGVRTLDIFPGYVNGHYVNWRPGPRDKIELADVFPPVPFDAFGVTIPVPRLTKHYLQLVYGDTWGTPLPSFKHPWRNFDDKVAKIS